MAIVFLSSMCFNPSQDSAKESQFKFNITLVYKTPEFCFGISNSKKTPITPKFSDFVSKRNWKTPLDLKLSH